MRRSLALAAALVLAGSMAACGSGDGDDEEDAGAGGSPTTRVIEAADFSFEPTTVEIDAGRAVTIEVHNAGQATHNLTIEDLGVDEDVEAGGTARARITPEAGSYAFRCKFHSGRMQGTITVT